MSTCPWGGYSAAAQDPLDPNDVWVASAAVRRSNIGRLPGRRTPAGAREVDQLTVSAPTIHSVTPNFGPVVGGQTVTVDGFDFGSETIVTVAGSPIPDIQPDAVLLHLRHPPSTPAGGTVQIQATNAFGSSSEDVLVLSPVRAAVELCAGASFSNPGHPNRPIRPARPRAASASSP